MKISHLQATFRGRVQGVGFRWLVKDEAEKHQIQGTVKNLSNGAVELYLQGPDSNIDKLLETLKKHPGVEEVVTHSLEASKDYFGFRILF